MPRTPDQLRADVVAIWQAGVAAVRPERLLPEWVRVEGGALWLGDEAIALDGLRRIVVVGAGKAGAGMAAALEDALGVEVCREKQLTGWVNVPADCVRPLRHIHLHAARPAGVNEPTAEGVRGAEEILRLVAGCESADLVICLLSGGGSALLPAPAEGVMLAQKQALTKHLSAAGANIAELNTVRKQLSRIKGGRLAAACRAGRLVSLVISDVAGDPLEIIASGPTVADASTPSDAAAILERHGAGALPEGKRVLAFLRARDAKRSTAAASSGRVENLLIANNATAVDAAGVEAERRGYSHAMVSSRTLEGEAEQVGRHLARMARSMRAQAGPDCLISGGEPVVRLAPVDVRGLGGRNQQLALAALIELSSHVEKEGSPAGRGIAILSGGTDGEDGPTDAAGAIVDERVMRAAEQHGLDARDFLRRNDAYHFFERTGGLLKTGPTQTNVCDLRVVVVERAVG